MKYDISWMENSETTVWFFPNDIPSMDPIHGIKKYPGRFPPTIPQILIQKYSEESDIILDPFLGGGTTLVEAKKLGRNSIGFDINPEAVEITKRKLDKLTNLNGYFAKAFQGDARNLYLKDKSIDLVITSPPYWNLIKYSTEKGCLANLDSINSFLKSLDQSIQEMYRVLKPNKWCSIVIGDSIDGWNFYPLGHRVQEMVEKIGFELKRVVIHIQSRTNSFLFGNNKVKDRVLKRGLFLIAHEYVIICKK